MRPATARAAPSCGPWLHLVDEPELRQWRHPGMGCKAHDPLQGADGHIGIWYGGKVYDQNDGRHAAGLAMPRSGQGAISATGARRSPVANPSIVAPGDSGFTKGPATGWYPVIGGGNCGQADLHLCEQRRTGELGPLDVRSDARSRQRSLRYPSLHPESERRHEERRLPDQRASGARTTPSTKTPARAGRPRRLQSRPPALPGSNSPMTPARLTRSMRTTRSPSTHEADLCRAIVVCDRVVRGSERLDLAGGIDQRGLRWQHRRSR